MPEEQLKQKATMLFTKMVKGELPEKRRHLLDRTNLKPYL
jgi:hypothetical protein